MKIMKRPDMGSRSGGWVQVGLAILSGVLASIAGNMLAKKQKSPVQDDKPTTLSTRGSFVNWFIGIREVGPVITWAGDREVRKEKVSGGKGIGSSPEQDVFYEAGWHVLGVGPGNCLHKILDNGKVIFNGPISMDSHPSGSTIDLGSESFTIYWGEVDQPINSFLGDPSRVSVSSRWPFAMYIQWNKKRLGTSPNWPVLTYIVERRPSFSTSLLSQSSAWYDAVLTLDGPTIDVSGFVSNADPDVGFIEVLQDQTNVFKPKATIALLGNGLPDGDYEIRRSEVFEIVSGPFSISIVTRIYFQSGTLGADGAGTMQTYSEDLSAGANIAHIMAELLFAPYPQGLALDPFGPEPWDIQSFEDLGVEAEAAGWRSSVVGTEGESAEAMFAAMLQDHGCMLPIDTLTGMLSLRRIRFPSGTLPNITDDVFSGSLSETEVRLDDSPTDKIIFEFSDRALQFATVTIAIDDDGQGFRLEHQSASKVPLFSTTHFDTASALAELRSPEELSDKSEISLGLSREARNLIPGDPIVVSGYEEVLRVVAVDVDPLSEEVRVSVVPDFYGAPLTDFVNLPGGGQPIIVDPQQDAQFDFVEIPEQLNVGSLAIMVLHVRQNSSILSSAIHLSRDNTTYTLWGTDPFVQTGGVLTSALDASGPSWNATGPEYTEEGPDNGTLTQDLTADPTNFGLGRQLAVVVSSAGKEICFLQRAAVVAAGVRRLDGLLRARYDTRKLDHPVGARVYIFDPAAATAISDPLLEVGEDLYVKSQPSTTAGSVNLDGVVPAGAVLQGKGLVPIRPDQVTLTAPRKNVEAYLTGEGITAAVSLSTSLSINTGAGFQNAGVVIADPSIPGSVVFELLTIGETVVDSKSGSALEQSWTNGELIAALGSETDFKVRVYHIFNSLTSASAQVMVTKL